MPGLACCTHVADKIRKCQPSFPICDALVRICPAKFVCCWHNFVLLATAEALPKFVQNQMLLQLFSPHTRLPTKLAVATNNLKQKMVSLGDRLFTCDNFLNTLLITFCFCFFQNIYTYVQQLYANACGRQGSVLYDKFSEESKKNKKFVMSLVFFG